MDIVASTVGSIAENISNRLFDAVGRQLGYLFHYNDNIGTLEKQAKKLEATRGTMQVKIDAAERNREIILPDVKNWISEVDNVSADAGKFLEDEVKANMRCFKGWCIDLRSRYRFSKAAKQKIVAISQLQEEYGNFHTLSQAAPPPSIISPAVGFSGIFKSRESIKNGIMEALKDDTVNIIGICGMGGVGKTTLVKEIGKRAEEQKLYDSVVMVVVSQTPNTVNIQREIASLLGLTSLVDYPESKRANFLWDRIKKEKRILIVLDDVWARIELEEIGIPFGKDHGGCKIVLTSRRKNVCDQMDCDKTFIVETLSKQESWALFKELVGMDVENSIISSIAREVAAECDGLPIAIVTVARALKNKDDQYVWIDAARQLKRSTPTNIEGMHENVISSLELSFNYLESEAKSLFLFCSLFPEDFNIYIEDLVRYGTGLRWFKDLETMEDIRVRTHAIVSALISSFLLIHDDEKYVKMHDVVRDVAHIIAPKYNQIFLVKAGIGLEEWPEGDTFESFTCISLMSNNIKTVHDGMECPQLQSLLLQNNPKLVLLDNFFQGMKDLRVLDLSGTQLLPTQLLPLPESLSLLANLRTLYLNDCILGDLSIIGHLRNLEILSLRHSIFREIPISFSQLIHLMLLDLNDCFELTRIAHGVISVLCKLEELHILCSSKVWDLVGVGRGRRSNAKLVELQYLSRLTSLQIFIPKPNLLPDNDILFKKLSSFTIIIGGATITNLDIFFLSVRKYSRKIMISVYGVMISQLLDCLTNLVIEKTEYLFIIGLENIFLDLVDKGLNELKSLTIRCLKVTYLVNTLERESNLTFQNLEELEIMDHPNLVEICHGEPPIQSFEKLKSLAVFGCNMLSNIVPSHLLQRFRNLESFKVYNCESVIYIFDCEELKVANGETKMLSSLKDLDLYELPEMTHIWKGDTQYINLNNLKRINLYSCPNLIKVFSPALLHSLICLEEMKIDDCDNLEEIFIVRKKEEEEYEEKGIVPQRKDHTTTSPCLGNLTSIEEKKADIWDHPNLVEICHGEPPVQSFEKLRVLNVCRCNRLSNIVPSHLLQRFQNLESLKVYNCESMAYIFNCEELKIANEETKLLLSLKDLDLGGLLGMVHIWKGDTQYINLCNLKRISLDRCPNLIKAFSLAILQSLICLEEIGIQNCDNLEEIFILGAKEEEEYEDKGIVPRRKDHTTTSPSLGNLTSIRIRNCSKLKNLFTPFIVKSLVKLRILEIYGCSKIEEIITKGELASTVQRIVFPSLSSLGLERLDNIACFSSGSYSIEFPALELLLIVECPNMKIFGYGEQLTPLLNKVFINYFKEKRWMGNLNSTVQQMFIEEEERRKELVKNVNG